MAAAGYIGTKVLESKLNSKDTEWRSANGREGNLIRGHKVCRIAVYHGVLHVARGLYRAIS